MTSPYVVPSSSVRLPADARNAVAEHRTVEVRNHERPAFWVLKADDFALVEPLLERHRAGKPVPVSELLTDDDFAVLAEERELGEGLDRAIIDAWGS